MEGKSITPFQNFFAGWFAAGAARTVACPFEITKVQLQTDDDARGVVATVKRMYQKEGWAGFYKGNIVGIIRIPLYSYSQLLSIKVLMAVCEPFFGPDVTGPPWAIMNLGGVLATIFTAPLDTVKTKLQVTPGLDNSAYQCPCCFVRDCLKRAWACASDTVAKGGWAALFAGLLPSVLAHVPQGLTRMCVQTQLPKLLGSDLSEISHTEAFVLGCLSLAVAEAVWLPLDAVRRRSQKGDPQAQDGVGTGIRAMQRKRGIAGLWSGVSANALRVLPYNATLVASYEMLTSLFVQI